VTDQRAGTSGRFPVVDLFSGVGGLSLGAARAGFQLRAAVELDTEALRAHKRNFPKAIHLRRSVRRISGRDLCRHVGLPLGAAFGLVGGPPCQGFSVIGRRDHTDPRNKLFTHFFRLVHETRPVFFLAENVPGILSDANARLLDAALSLVPARYQLLKPILVSAHDYGAPTSRTRVFFVGFDPERINRLDALSFAPPRQREFIRVRDALRGLPNRVDPSWQREENGWRRVSRPDHSAFAARLWGLVPQGVGDRQALLRLRDHREASGNLGSFHSSKVARRYAAVRPGDIDKVTKSRRLVLDGFCPTLRAGTGFDRGRFQAVRPLHPVHNRVITPREGARLQGFPDWFQFAPTKWHSFRLLGSSVSPIVAERLLVAVRRALRQGVPHDR
jgi:DNA (cytosine-5)-methyltransferase 1